MRGGWCGAKARKREAKLLKRQKANAEVLGSHCQRQAASDSVNTGPESNEKC